MQDWVQIWLSFRNYADIGINGMNSPALPLRVELHGTLKFRLLLFSELGSSGPTGNVTTQACWLLWIVKALSQGLCNSPGSQWAAHRTLQILASKGPRIFFEHLTGSWLRSLSLLPLLEKTLHKKRRNFFLTTSLNYFFSQHHDLVPNEHSLPDLIMLLGIVSLAAHCFNALLACPARPSPLPCPSLYGLHLPPGRPVFHKTQTIVYYVISLIRRFQPKYANMAALQLVFVNRSSA